MNFQSKNGILAFTKIKNECIKKNLMKIAIPTHGSCWKCHLLVEAPLKMKLHPQNAIFASTKMVCECILNILIRIAILASTKIEHECILNKFYNAIPEDGS